MRIETQDALGVPEDRGHRDKNVGSQVGCVRDLVTAYEPIVSRAQVLSLVLEQGQQPWDKLHPSSMNVPSCATSVRLQQPFPSLTPMPAAMRFFDWPQIPACPPLVQAPKGIDRITARAEPLPVA